MKRAFSVFLSTLILILSIFSCNIMSFAEDFGGEVFSCGENAYCTIDNNVMTIRGTGKVDFGKYIYYVDKVIVSEGITSLGERCFLDFGLTDVELPSTLVNIGEGAFYGANIKSITFPENLEHIGDSAFSDTSLESIVLPSNLKTVGDSAFIDSTAKNVVINGNTKFGSRVFYGNKKLKNVYVNGDCRFGEDDFEGCKALNVVFSSSVTQIGDGAFRNSGIKSIDIPSSVKSIGKQAFAYCNALTTVNLNEGLTVIGDEAFYMDKKINKIIIPSTVKKAKSAFHGCTAMKSAVVKNKIIDYGEFFGCESLTKVKISSNATAIKDYGFKESGIKEIKLPKKLKTIGFEAFRGCKSLVSITLPKSVTSIKEGAFLNCESLKSAKLNSKLKTIGKDAFASTKVKSVTIPSSVTKIGSHAFGFTYNWNYATNKPYYTKNNGISLKCKSKAAKSYANKYGF